MTETRRRTFIDICRGQLTPSDQSNVNRYTVLLFVWMLVFLGATFVITNEVVRGGALGWLVALMPSAFGIIAALAYMRFLREADELVRAIELRALALAVGAGFAIWPAYTLLGRLGVPVDAWSEVPIMAMIGAYVFGVLAGRRHYA